MNNSWTFGQYSVFRAIFGLYLTIHFLNLFPWASELFSSEGMLPSGSLSPLFHLFPSILLINDSSTAVHLLLMAGFVSSILLTIGKFDRYAAIVCWYVLTALFDRNPLIANPSLPYVGWLLLATACLPDHSRLGHSWRMPKGVFLAAWIAMAVGYSYSGYMKLTSPSWIDGSAIRHVLNNPLAHANFVTTQLLALPSSLIQFLTWSALLSELLFAPLSLFSRLRPWMWLTLLSMHIGLLMVIRFPDLSFGMIILHIFTFDPAWVRPKKGHALKIFYDGSCGLCHGFVRFTLSENINRTAFVFMPLQGKLFQELVKVRGIAPLPDSIVVYDMEKKILLYKTSAIIRVLEGLGGLWRGAAFLLNLIPLKIANLGYDFVAAVRHSLIKKPDAPCPLLPREWRQFIVMD